MTEVYLLCYSHILQYFVGLNLFLQRDEPIIAALHEQVQCVGTKFSLAIFAMCFLISDHEIPQVADVKVYSCKCLQREGTFYCGF